MTLRHNARRLKNKIDFFIFKFRSSGKEKFECPVCEYTGPFMDVAPSTGLRKHAKCPNCSAAERQRIQFLVVKKLLSDISATDMKMLHFAPEPFFREYFSKRFGQYESADLNMKDVDHNVDLQQLPFDSGSYDFVFASHVLEHIPDDEKAISEIRRVLKPNGIAILPVPIVAEQTVEYPEPNPHEDYHVRAPGVDYFDKYERYFSRVERFSSDSLPEKHQLFVFEDRSQWPTKKCPLRPAMSGEKHIDVVPVCYV
ncbi:MAG: methyltransferase domain-containing protein [Gammaproteobacteria bacterium]|nr:methyltransferase domain-containing protein [Gammaproteobacteria bacterium]